MASISTFTGRERIVRLLIEHGADVNAADKNGVTAIIEAAVEGKKRNLLIYLK